MNSLKKGAPLIKKIGFSRYINEKEQNYLTKSLGENVELQFPLSSSEEDIANSIENSNVIIGNGLDKKYFDLIDNCKYFLAAGAGIERIPLDFFREKNIITTSSHSNSLVVAEYALALAMTVSKKQHLLRDWAQEDNFSGVKKFNLTNISLIKKRIGLVGYGSIGKNIKNLLNNFECEFLIHKKNKSSELDKLYSLDEIFSLSDVIFISLPKTKKTIDLIDERKLELCKPNTVIVNIGRPDVFFEDDLFHFIQQNKNVFIAVDSLRKPLAEYQKDGENKLSLKNFLFSPYRANFYDEKPFHLDDVIFNLNAIINGNPLINIISKSDEY